MEQPFILSDEEQDPEPQEALREASQVHNEDAELIFVGVEHVNEDAELIFVGMTSNSKPANSNILNRVTPGSRLKRKRGHLRKTTTQRQQPSSPAAPVSETVIVLPGSPAESRSTDSPIIIEPLSEPDYISHSPQVVPGSSSKCSSPSVTLSSSKHGPVRAALAGGDLNESSYVSKCHSPAVNTGARRPEPSVDLVEERSSALSPSGTFHTSDPQQGTPSDVASSVNHVVNGTPPSEDAVRVSPTKVHPRQENGLAGAHFSSLASQGTYDPKRGSLTLLLSDFYYGHHKGDGQPEKKTHTTFKCPSCLKALKNVKFMNHTKHHLELEKQGSDGWENHTTCQHCHRKFTSPFQLECHVDRVHTTPDPSTVCRICELSFETDQVLLQHMKDNHKPGEMPYVCQICKYRSSTFADVEMHFRKCHVNTKNLLCPFCLKIFKTGMPYMCHYRGHWERNGHHCSKCRLQFLTFKEKMEHKTLCHQMFKKPKQLEGLPPETKVVIQVSAGPIESESVKVASITVSTTDWELVSPSCQGRPSKKSH